MVPTKEKLALTADTGNLRSQNPKGVCDMFPWGGVEALHLSSTINKCFIWSPSHSFCQNSLSSKTV